jgi:hypothetical protein
MRKRIMLLALALALLLGLWANGDLRAKQRYGDFITRTPLAEGDYLVIGFPGGRERWNNEHQIARRIALRLRARHLPGVHIETVENKQRHLAVELVRNALDRNGDKQLDAQERASARIILYGQSFGGAATAKVARELHVLDVPVLLTVQVDSVGRGDAAVPPNVRKAANLFQRNGPFIRGEREIRADDPARTQILGNWQYDYRGKRIDLTGKPWWKRLFSNAHTRMEFDPEVWAKLEELILAELPR